MGSLKSTHQLPNYRLEKSLSPSRPEVGSPEVSGKASKLSAGPASPASPVGGGAVSALESNSSIADDT